MVDRPPENQAFIEAESKVAFTQWAEELVIILLKDPPPQFSLGRNQDPFDIETVLPPTVQLKSRAQTITEAQKNQDELFLRP